MRFNFVRRPVLYVDAATVALPTRQVVTGIVDVSISDSPVVLFLKVVDRAAGNGIATVPELLDEVFALFIGVKILECSALAVLDDVDDVLIKPLFVWTLLGLLRGWFCLCTARALSYWSVANS